MKNTESNKLDNLPLKLAYIGGGVGVGFFAVFGLLNASFIGGVLGINIVGTLFGYPIPGTLVARMIIVFAMLTGVMVTGLVFILSGVMAGWLLGILIALAVHPHKAVKEATVKHK
jgi:hypothetical protein